MITENAPPLPVYYQFAGRRFLLLWWTEDERHHLVVAKHEASLGIAFDRRAA